MPNTFITADLHFGHKGIVERYGRPFATVEEHDQTLVDNINKDVKPSDTLVIAGDVVFPQTGFESLAKINCRNMILTMGNHERHKLEKYLKYFKEVHAMKLFKDIIVTHMPIHPSEFYRFGTNVHGHKHGDEVLAWNATPDPRYLCVSVEHTNYKPLALEEVRERIKTRREEFVLDCGLALDITIGGKGNGPG
jgi:calcineurin-like phosphoesterase family protein